MEIYFPSQASSSVLAIGMTIVLSQITVRRSGRIGKVQWRTGWKIHNWLGANEDGLL